MANTETNTDNTDILTDDTEIDTIYGKVPLVVNGRKTAVLDADDVIAMVPKLAGHKRLVERLLHWLSVDKVNAVHAHNCKTPGPAFVEGLLRDFDIKLRIDGHDVLDNLPEGPFVTVSNHPFGALDGITLIHLIASRRPEYKVMVNMILGRIWAMEPNFIAVDAMSSNDPAKKTVSVHGIKQAMDQVKSGRPLGFFPAGAVSKVNCAVGLSTASGNRMSSALSTSSKCPSSPYTSMAATRGSSISSALYAGNCAPCVCPPRFFVNAIPRCTYPWAIPLRSKNNAPMQAVSKNWECTSKKPLINYANANDSQDLSYYLHTCR